MLRLKAAAPLLPRQQSAGSQMRGAVRRVSTALTSTRRPPAGASGPPGAGGAQNQPPAVVSVSVQLVTRALCSFMPSARPQATQPGDQEHHNEPPARLRGKT